MPAFPQAALAVPASAQAVQYSVAGSYDYVVPAGVNRLIVSLKGAQGGQGTQNGGYGGWVRGTVAVSGLTSVQVNVGGAGSAAAGGFNGGGSPGPASTTMSGGGGATDIRINGIALPDRVLVAGGGGGASGTAAGGNGGQNATSGGTGPNGAGGGGGATVLNPGTAGTASGSGSSGQPGAAGSGGDGAPGSSAGGAGGGGGYNGGGGGGSDASGGAGGGGGSSFEDTSVVTGFDSQDGVGVGGGVATIIPVTTGAVIESYSDAATTYSVPAGVADLRVQLVGAGGGGSSPSANPKIGGLGAYVAATVPATGDQLDVYAGGRGSDGATGTAVGGGFNGGGAGPLVEGHSGGGGGGGTDIRPHAGDLASRLLTAGGGGGSGYGAAASPFGGNAGSSGAAGDEVSPTGCGGGGGATSSSPGVHSSQLSGDCVPGSDGSLGTGGSGSAWGAGGGGGYYGGAGGSGYPVGPDVSTGGASGGGGSSYGAQADVTYLPAFNYGDGFAVISPPVAQTVSFSQPSDAVVNSGPVILSATATSGLAISITSDTPAVCSVSGDSASLVGAGTCALTATQAGDETFGPASASVSFQVSAVPPPPDQPQKLVKCPIPKKIGKNKKVVVLQAHCTTTAGQKVKLDVKISAIGKVSKHHPALWKLTRKAGKVTLQTYRQRLKIRLHYSAAATAGFDAYAQVTIIKT